MKYADLNRDEPFFVKTTSGEFEPVRINDLSPTEGLIECEFDDGFRLWFRADAIYSERNILASIDPALFKEGAL